MPINNEYKIVLLLSPDYVNKLTFDYIKSILLVSALVLIIILLISFAVYKIISKNSITGGMTIKSFKNLLITSIVFTQIALGGYILSNYTNEYQNSLDKMANIVSNVIDKDIEYIVKQGVPYDELTGVEEYLQNICKDISEVVKISISNLQKKNYSTKNNIKSNKIQILDQDYKCRIQNKPRSCK